MRSLPTAASTSVSGKVDGRMAAMRGSGPVEVEMVRLLEYLKAWMPALLQSTHGARRWVMCSCLKGVESNS